MLYPIAAIIVGLVVLVWSADLFVDGAAKLAVKLGMSPLLVGMLILGFGTSAPEMVISALASFDGKPELAIGNALGSNIANIALILGMTALILPITVRSKVLVKELPLLALITFVSLVFLYNGTLSRAEAIWLLIFFHAFVGWSVWKGKKKTGDALEKEMEAEIIPAKVNTLRSSLHLVLGLGLLIASSRALVWGAIEVATFFGVGELVIGLTVVAVGTSLPELASSIAAARKGEDDIALGNVIGSNIFNTLAVMGIAGTIMPASFSTAVFWRDGVTLALLTLSLFILGYGYKNDDGKISRSSGALLLLSYGAYTVYLIMTMEGY